MVGEEVVTEDEATLEPEPEASAPGPALPEPAPEPVAEVAVEAGPFCTSCGTKNPAHARFCYQCGQALVTAANPAPPTAPVPIVPVAESRPAVPPPMPPPAPASVGRPSSDAGKRALALVGVALLAVVVLFFITQASTDPPAATPAAATGTAPAGAAAPPPAEAAPELPAEVEARAAALEDEIAAATGDERLAKQEDLAGLYARSGAFALAAPIQQEVAEVRQTALAWADAGSLYLAHMLRTQGETRTFYAQRAAENYERSVALDDTDLDVRTDLATAYLNDGLNPMQAVETVKEVLGEDPEHVRANFNFGLMLAQISRTDQAQERFEKVLTLTEAGDPVRERAEQELARLQAAASGTANG